MNLKVLPLVVFLTGTVAASAATDEPTINDLVVAPGVPAAQRETDLTAVRAFYGFWNSGDDSLLQRALAPSFTDHTLPPGRPQRPSGPASASKTFRTAVPDLSVTIEKLVIAGDMTTVHMVFIGHFTGTFGTVRGTGQPIRFIATDLLKITKGKITDNWHIEDNLTLLQQMGVAKVGP